jgi:hypothetical protein
LFDVSTGWSTPSLAQLQEIATYMDRRADAVGRKKIAVVTAAPVSYGVARQFQALTDRTSLTVSIFPTRAEALEWLGHKDPG